MMRCSRRPLLLACAALASVLMGAALIDRNAVPGMAAQAQQQPPATPTAPVAEPKTDAIVPPMQRKAPPPAKTSVPIVPSPKGRKGKTKPAPKPKAKLPAAKDPKAAIRKAPATARTGLGLKPDPALKCSAGYHYAPQQLRCVKDQATPAKANPKAAPKSAPKPAPATPAASNPAAPAPNR